MVRNVLDVYQQSTWTVCWEVLYRRGGFLIETDCPTDSGDLLLASCSQDCAIRIWRVSSSSRTSTQNEVEKEFDELRLTSNIFTVMDSGRVMSLI